MSQRRRYPTYPGQQPADPNVPQVVNNAPQTSVAQIPVFETQGEAPFQPVQQVQQQPPPTVQPQYVSPPEAPAQHSAVHSPHYPQPQPVTQVQVNYGEVQPDLQSAFKKSNVIQFTHAVLPMTASELNTSKLPVGFIMHPHLDEEIGAVDFNTELRVNPPRCQNCKAFISCYSKFDESGHHMCALCGDVTALDFEYERLARLPEWTATRKELQCEAYEIAAPDIYRVRRGETFETLAFVIEISTAAITSGLVRTAAKVIREQLLEMQQLEQRTMVSITLFGTQIHYLIFRNSDCAEVYTIPDVDNAFIPAPRDVIVALKSRGAPILSVLDNLEKIALSIPPVFSSKQGLTRSQADTCLYAAIEQVYKCMQSVGGKILYFAATTPSCGMGSLHETFEKRKQAGKTTESIPLKDALTNASELYTDLGVKCALANVSVDGIVATYAEYVDITTLAELSRTSAGTIRHIEEFSPDVHKQLLFDYINQSLDNRNVMEACTRLRTSKNVDVKQFYGPGQHGTQNLINFAHCSDQMAVGGELVIVDSLKPGQYAYLQMSYLYTAKNNGRFVRVVTKRISAGTVVQFIQSINATVQTALLAKKTISALRKNADVQSQTVVLQSFEGAAQSVHLSSQATFEHVCKAVQAELFQTLHQYSKLTNQQIVGQFPPAFQELIAYVFALGKCISLKPLGARVFVDERAAFAQKLEGCGVEATISAIYPLCVNIEGQRTRLNIQALQPDQIYIVGGFYAIYVYIGANVDLNTIQEMTIGTRPNVTQLIEMNLQVENQTVQKLRQQIERVKVACGAPLPVYCVSAQGKLVQPVYQQMVESRVDGPEFGEFCKLLQEHLK